MNFLGITDLIRDRVAKHRPRLEGLDAAWVIDHKLLQMSTPGGGLASLWRNPEEDVLRFLKKHCIKYVIKCNTTCRYNIALFEENGISVSDIHWPDHTTPSFDQALLLVTFMWQIFQSGACAIHCTAGIGRSGISSVAFLIFLGYPAEQCITWVRARRPGSVQNEHQVQFCRDFEQYIQDNVILVHHMRAAAYIPPSNIECVKEYFLQLYDCNVNYRLYNGYNQRLGDRIDWAHVRHWTIEDAVREAIAKVSQVTDPSLHFLQTFMDGDDNSNGQGEYVDVPCRSGDGKPERDEEGEGTPAETAVSSGEGEGDAATGTETTTIPPATTTTTTTTTTSTTNAGGDTATTPIFFIHGYHMSIADELGSRDNVIVAVPRVVQRLTRELLRAETPAGLFVLPGTTAGAILEAQEHLCTTNSPMRRADLVLACGYLLIAYFRSLPQGLLPLELRTRALENCSDEKYCISVIHELQEPYRSTFQHMINFLAVISRRSATAHTFSLANLATLWAQPLLGLSACASISDDVINGAPLGSIEKSGWNSFKMPALPGSGSDGVSKHSGITKRRHTDTPQPEIAPSEASSAPDNDVGNLGGVATPPSASPVLTAAKAPEDGSSATLDFKLQRQRFQSSPAELQASEEDSVRDMKGTVSNTGRVTVGDVRDVHSHWPPDTLGRAAGFIHTLVTIHVKERWGMTGEFRSSMGITLPMQIETELTLARASEANVGKRGDIE